MEVHEAAQIFPIDEEHVAELGRDIATNGLLLPIETLDGKIIDGRRRLRACELADVKPKFHAIETSDPVAYVLSLNLHRRHLTETQRGMIGARAKKLYEAQAKERMHEGQKSGGRGHKKNLVENLPPSLAKANGRTVAGKARDLAGEAVGVSGKTIEYGVTVLSKGVPELIAAVDADEIAISTAARAASLPPEEQKDLVKAGRGRSNARKDEIIEPPNGNIKGVGVIRANEAINCLIRIPKNDALRKRGFQIVTDWIRKNP